ncbi:MAG: hypothetical protein JWM12_2398 [Ilumatobacteraceae bacterium]|nr:hypothetical protein [Ilumatobacteraceae bacterium]
MVASAFEGVLAGVRRSIGGAIFERIAGSDGAEVGRRMRSDDGPRWFAADSPIARVHGDAAMFIGGLTALLLQSLHPLAMAGVDQHSGYRGDPWGRLARTSRFLAVTTYGSARDAQRQIEVVRAVHRRVTGVAPDGRPYAASDPHLLSWVHVVEVSSFVSAHRRFGATSLTDAEYDVYAVQSGRIATELGARDVPSSMAEVRAMFAAYRPELASTPAARATARYLVVNPPLPLALRPAYLPLAAAAVSLVPRWARWPLRLPWLPVTEATVGRVAGDAVTQAIRWALPAAEGIAARS